MNQSFVVDYSEDLLFYGVRTHLNEVRSFMNLVGETSIYDFIYSRDLSYQQIGLIEGTEEVIIGKNMHMEFEFDSMTIDFENGNFKLSNQEIIDVLNEEEKKEIKNKLCELGLFEDPEYMMFVNY